jgi:putative transposase
MSRRPRFPVKDLPFHVVQRGNDRGACFFDDADRLIYLSMLSEACTRYGLLVHAYVLMTNHVHLLLTPCSLAGISRAMQSVGSRYVGYVNRSKARTGTLWEGRYRACLVADDRHMLAACRYIDLNPVRAGIVRHPGDYRWSSYLALARLRPDPLVNPHPALEQLGGERGRAYAHWCEQGEQETDVIELRKATAGELAFGSSEFKSKIAMQTARATVKRPPGFPPRQARAEREP